MKYPEKWWITLGNTQFAGHYLATVTEEEAVALLTKENVHADRVKNAWKIANGKKDQNTKKQETQKTEIITPEATEKPKVETAKRPKLEDLRKQYPHIKARSVDAFLAKLAEEEK